MLEFVHNFESKLENWMAISVASRRAISPSFRKFHTFSPQFSTYDQENSDKAHGVCYKPPYIDSSTFQDSTQAVWIQRVLNIICFAIPNLPSAGDGHKLTVTNRR